MPKGLAPPTCRALLHVSDLTALASKYPRAGNFAVLTFSLSLGDEGANRTVQATTTRREVAPQISPLRGPFAFHLLSLARPRNGI